jgi:hypothetical protein
MAADSNSMIAWHRAQIARLRETLRHLETADFAYGKIAGAKPTGQPPASVVEVKRKIRESQEIITAHDRQTRRPLTTDHHTLASARWSTWNARGSSSVG